LEKTSKAVLCRSVLRKNDKENKSEKKVLEISTEGY
jgi:hypothetical protein